MWQRGVVAGQRETPEKRRRRISICIETVFKCKSPLTESLNHGCGDMLFLNEMTHGKRNDCSTANN